MPSSKRVWLTRAERIRRGFFRLDRDRTAAAHCGHALVKLGAPIGAPSSVPLLAVHARTCRPAALGHLLAPLRPPGAEIGHWWEPDKLMGYCVALYFAKLLVWDKVL